MYKTIPFLIITILLFSCSGKDDAGGTYVKPSIDSRGRFRKGYVRKPVSTDKNAIKNQNRSKYYYETRGKFRKRKKRND